MNERRMDDSEIVQIEDLATRELDARDAEQVRGGLNPQPLPPKWLYPIYQPPVYNPLPVVVQW